jgi:hypothetical protein
MPTGNIRDFRTPAGRLVIDVSAADQDVPFATASFRGEYEGRHLVGRGASITEAVSDLRRITGVHEEADMELTRPTGQHWFQFPSH